MTLSLLRNKKIYKFHVLFRFLSFSVEKISSQMNLPNIYIHIYILYQLNYFTNSTRGKCTFFSFSKINKINIQH